MKDLQSQVQDILPVAINKAILATALVREGNKFPAPDTRPADVIEFENALRNAGGLNDAAMLLASKLTGHDINTRVYQPSTLKLHFPAVLVATKPYGWEEDDYYGVPFNTPVIVVVRETSRGGSRLRWADKTALHVNIINTVFTPATDAQVAEAMTALFDARPAKSVLLFSSDTGEVE